MMSESADKVRSAAHALYANERASKNRPKCLHFVSRASAFIKARIISIKVLIIQIILNDTKRIAEVSESNRWAKVVEM